MTPEQMATHLADREEMVTNLAGLGRALVVEGFTEQQAGDIVVEMLRQVTLDKAQALRDSTHPFPWMGRQE